jgi:hypothetical protein
VVDIGIAARFARNLLAVVDKAGSRAQHTPQILAKQVDQIDTHIHNSGRCISLTAGTENCGLQTSFAGLVGRRHPTTTSHARRPIRRSRARRQSLRTVTGTLLQFSTLTNETRLDLWGGGG